MTKNTLLFLIILFFCPSFMLAQEIALYDFGSKVIIPENDYLGRPWRVNPTHLEDSSKLRVNLSTKLTRFTGNYDENCPTTNVKGLDFSAKARLNPTTDITFDVDIDDYPGFSLQTFEFYYRKTVALAEDIRLKGGINTGMLFYRKLYILREDFVNGPLVHSEEDGSDNQLKTSPYVTVGAEFEYKRFSLGSAVRYFPEEPRRNSYGDELEGSKYAFFTFHTSYQFKLSENIDFTPEIVYGQSNNEGKAAYLNLAFSYKDIGTFETLPLRMLYGLPVMRFTYRPFEKIKLGYIYNQVSYTREDNSTSVAQDIDHLLQVSYIW